MYEHSFGGSWIQEENNKFPEKVPQTARIEAGNAVIKPPQPLVVGSRGSKALAGHEYPKRRCANDR